MPTDHPHPPILPAATVAAMVERAEKATPGPWVQCRYSNYNGFAVLSKTDPLFGCIAERWENMTGYKSTPDARYEQRDANANFIEHARADLPDIAASHEALRAAHAATADVLTTTGRLWNEALLEQERLEAENEALRAEVERLRDCERVALAKTLPGWNIELGHPPEGFRYYLTKPLEQIAIIIGSDYWTWSNEARAAIDATREGANRG